MAVALVAAALLCVAAAARPAQASVARGIGDPALTNPGVDPTTQSEMLTQIGDKQLKASWVRFVVSWAAAEPNRPQDGSYAEAVSFDQTYLAGVDNAVALARQNGLKVMITFTGVPEWASDSYYWTHNPFGSKGYSPRYVMNTDEQTLLAFRYFCQYVAARYSGQVAAYECWNEPNHNLTLYPQATASDPLYGVHVYIKMLKAFSAGILAGDPGPRPEHALRVAGATAPRGYTGLAPLSLRRLLTSPTRFARAIKNAGAAKYFDAYSHHPYMPGSVAHPWPEAAPPHPETTVTLQNLGTLIALFPTKPFYLTEYGYQTAPCGSFSGQYFSLATQAAYLKRAYAYVARYKQVKVLMWYLLADQVNGWNGFYTGLCKGDMTKKPAWYVFAGGNHLILNATATSVRRGASVRLLGYLRSDAAGAVAGKSLLLQARLPGSSVWRTLKTLSPTDGTGHYAVTLWPSRSRYYRVQWSGVITSRTRFVAVR